ncbi:MAG: DUF6475 domain-containing protein [Acidobacteriaceae bacterium]
MKKTDYERFANLLNAFAEIHGKPLSTGAIGLWWQALERFDITQIEDAFSQIVKDPDKGQFMPKPADVIRAIEGSKVDRAALAWGKVLDAARRVGAYADVVFDDAAIHAAIEDQGGWPKVCRTEVDELGYLQHRFCESHRAYTARGEFEYPALLTGDANSSNRRTGHQLQPPALVGDVAKANGVFERGSTGKTQITNASGIAHSTAARISLVKGVA